MSLSEIAAVVGDPCDRVPDLIRRFAYLIVINDMDALFF